MPEDATQTLGSARTEYYSANGLPPDGGIDEEWVHARIGPVPFAFPNSDSRRALVPYHDLHHLVTGYRTDLAGEAQVGEMRTELGLDVTSLSASRDDRLAFGGWTLLAFMVAWILHWALT
jgi:hypothetical protein